VTDSPDTPGSPPCSLHEWQESADPSISADIAGWRRTERARLFAVREAIEPEARRQQAAAIGRKLLAAVAELTADEPADIAVYWPIRAEPDLQDCYAGLAARGMRLLLPVVVEKDQPLRFHRWRPGDELGRDRLGIPAPLDAPARVPGIVVMPFVGIDLQGYRLGNGGGYYDRTLPGIAPDAMRIAVGYASCEIRTIYPQAHDVPAHIVVTDETVKLFNRGGGTA
jgi:5-formyltetrahydrofolate cyclo-ligase